MADFSIPPNLHRFPNPPSPDTSQSSNMEQTLQVETDSEEWEILSANTSFLEFGLEDIEDLISNEIVYTDYLVEEEPKLLIQQISAAHNDQEEEEEEEEESVLQFKEVSISHVLFKMIDPSSDPKQSSAAEFDVREESEASSSASVLLVEEEVSLGEKGEENGIGMWRWGFMGFGALFSIGAAAAAVAAATVWVVVLGGLEGKQPPCRRRRNPSNLDHFRFHDEDKSVSQVVEKASRLNQALAAARGGPAMMRTAKISFGRCYDGL